MSTSEPAPTLPSMSPGSGESVYASPPYIQAPPERSYEVRQELNVAAWVITALVGVGLIAGVIWVLVSPTMTFQLNDSSQVAVLSTEPEQLAAADGWFAIIGVFIGLLAGFRAWWQTRGHEPGVVAGLFVGGLLGSLTMLGVGALLRRSNLENAPSAGVGANLHAGLAVHATGVLLLESVAALVLWLVLDLLIPREDPPVIAPEPKFTPPPKHAGPVE